jgi:acetyl esterase/lipase
MVLSFLLAMGASIRARTTRGLAYGSQDRQALDVYAPVGADGEAPVVVFAHSAWPRLPSRRHFALAGQMLASRGLVTVIPDFQVLPAGRYPGFIEDVAQATAWAKANARRFGGDPTRLFVAGHAGGAYIAAMLALEPRWLADAGLDRHDIRGMVGVSGLYDVTPSDSRHIAEAFGVDDASPALQPATYASADAPPMLLIAGGRDHRDPDRNTGALARALRAVNGRVTEIRYPLMGDRKGLHSLSGSLRFRANALDEVERFIRLHSPALAA